MERGCALRIYSKMQGHKYIRALSVPLADIPKVFHSTPRSMIDQIDTISSQLGPLLIQQ